MSVNSIKLPPLGRVKYIQTYLPTTSHITNASVLEVKTLEDLNSNKLGVSDWGKSCLTCDNPLETCPGHIGHLNLPIPIYRIFYIKRLVSILNCICIYCQKLRLPKRDKRYKWIRGLPLKHRLLYLEKSCKSYKYCGDKVKEDTLTCAEPIDDDDDENMYHGNITCDTSAEDIINHYECHGCDHAFVRFSKDNRDGTFIKALIPLSEYDLNEYIKGTWEPFVLTPEYLLECLKHLSEETQFMLGCDEWNDPTAVMWDVLPIPSLNTRPHHTFEGMGGAKKRVFSDWTKLLRNIVTTTLELKEVMKHSNEDINITTYTMNNIESTDYKDCFDNFHVDDKKQKDIIRKKLKEQSKRIPPGAKETAWMNLHKQVAAFHSESHKNLLNKGSSYGKPLENVEERYKHQKMGRLRGNVIARRVNYAGRGVLEGSVYLKVGEVGLPKVLCMNLSRKVYVNRINLTFIHKLILNGPYEYPGCSLVMLKSGREIDLVYYENRRDLKMQDILFVRRHLVNGDHVLVGRQPTLHKPSEMAFRVRVITGFAIRLHYAVFHPMGADCDGDEVNVHVLQNIEAVAEAEVLCAVKTNILKDGVTWIKFILNTVVGAYLMTRPNVLFTQSQVHYITQYMDLWEYPEPKHTHPEKLWTSHSIISLLFPSDFTMNFGDLVIEKGQLLSGQLDDQKLNGYLGIIQNVYRDYGEDETMEFIHSGYLLFQCYLDLFGHSAGYFDCTIDFHHKDMVPNTKITDETKTCAGTLASYVLDIYKIHDLVYKLQKYTDSFPNRPADNHPQIETNIRQHIDKINQFSTDSVYDYHKFIDRKVHGNGILHMIDSGAKASKNTLNQMSGIVGQVYVMYRRYSEKSSHYLPGKNSLHAYGFISDNYSSGLGLKAVIAEAHSTCESVIGKNKGTARSGYTGKLIAILTCLYTITIHSHRLLFFVFV